MQIFFIPLANFITMSNTRILQVMMKYIQYKTFRGQLNRTMFLSSYTKSTNICDTNEFQICTKICCEKFYNTRICGRLKLCKDLKKGQSNFPLLRLEGKKERIVVLLMTQCTHSKPKVNCSLNFTHIVLL